MNGVGHKNQYAQNLCQIQTLGKLSKTLASQLLISDNPTRVDSPTANHHHYQH